MARRISVGERLAGDMDVDIGSSKIARRGFESLFRFFGISDMESIEQGCLLAVVSSLRYDEAQLIAREVVMQRKAVRADIVPRVSSIIWSKDDIEEIEESFVLIVTKEDLFYDLVKAIRSIPQIELPEIIALPILRGGSIEIAGEDRPARLEITLGEAKSVAWLGNSETAQEILETLPIATNVNVWRKEIFFSVPVVKEIENGVDKVNVGDIAYWPPAKSICIFLGGASLDHGGMIRSLTPVEVIGRVENPELLLEQASQGGLITVRRY